jgi:tetratricopeptide (TPR) repeat protein
MSGHEFEDAGSDASQEAELWRQIGSNDSRVKAEGLAAMGTLIFERGKRNGKALPFFEEAAALYEGMDDLENAAVMLLRAGQTLYWSERLDEALTSLERGAGFASREGATESEVEILHSMALIYNDRKDRTNALNYYKMAYELGLSIGHPWVRFMANDYARALRKAGQAESALEFLSERRVGAQASGDDFPLVMSDAEMAPVLIEKGEYQAAYDIALEAFKVASYVEAPREIDRTQFHMVRALNLLGRYAEALQNAEELKGRKRYRAKVKHKLRVDLEVARALAGLGDASGALEVYNKVIPLFEAFTLRELATQAAFEAAGGYLTAGNDLDAEVLLHKVIATGSSLLALESSVLLGAIYESRESWGSVVSAYEPLVSDPTNQFSLWFPSVLQSLAMAYLRLDRISDAETAAIAVIESKVDPSLCKGDAWYVRSTLALAAGDRAAAGRYGRKALKAYLLAGDTSRAAFLAEYL